MAHKGKANIYRGLAAKARSALRATWTHIGVMVTIIVVLWVCIGAHLMQVRAERTANVIRENKNLTLAAEQDISGMIAGIDQLLLFIRTARVGNPSQFDIDSWIDGTQSIRANFQLAIVDRDGMLQPNRHNLLKEPIDLSDRSNFGTFRSSQSDALLISEPLKLRSTGKWSVQFSRRITAADGSFDGLVVLSLDPSWLTRLYRALDVGQGALMLTGTDGIVRGRASSSGLGMGQNILSSDLFTAGPDRDQGNLMSVSPLDGVERFVSFQRLPDYPLIVSIGMNVADVLAPYYHERTNYTLAGVGLTTLILVIGFLLIDQSQRILRSRQVLSAAVENISQGLMMIDENGQMPLINSRAIELLAIPTRILAGVPSFKRLLKWQLDTHEFGRETEGERLIVARAERSRFDFQNSCYERVRPDGRHLEVRTQLLAGGGAMRTFTDITRRKQSEARILHLAHHDALTGLPNRTLLNDRLALALDEARRDGGRVAVLALDLNRFKAINDGFGHAAGDQLLGLVAGRLSENLRVADTLARLGGDEFVVIQTNADRLTEVRELANRLLKTLSEPFELDGHQLRIGASVGVAVYPTDGNNADALLKNADTAQYRAKTERHDGLCFYEAEMGLRLRERCALERDLRMAVGTGQLRLHYQPVFDSVTRSITGFEALLRWRHPVLGDISPMTFIPIAEETGIILPIGTWVLEEACRAAAAWEEPKRIAVNLSAAQLRSDQLPAEVADILRRTGLPPYQLELEVTETLMISNPGQAFATLRELQDTGIRIACDDFGTGYSSFHYLQKLAFDRVKIDKSFVQELGTTSTALRIVHAILAMARSLGMDVTAEGVETEQQLSLLIEHGCGEVQGFLLGRPMPSDQVRRYLRDARAASRTYQSAE